MQCKVIIPRPKNESLVVMKEVLKKRQGKSEMIRGVEGFKVVICKS